MLVRNLTKEGRGGLHGHCAHHRQYPQPDDLGQCGPGVGQVLQAFRLNRQTFNPSFFVLLQRRIMRRLFRGRCRRYCIWPSHWLRC